MHDLLANWASLYSGSALIKTLVGYCHIVGLLAGGGCAIAADRALLATKHDDAEGRRRHLHQAESIHRVVIWGLVVTVVSGLLLLAADLDTYIHAKVFWVKMAFVAALLLNGLLIVRGERAAEAGRTNAWPALRRTAWASLTLWFVTTFLGAVLPNV